MTEHQRYHAGLIRAEHLRIQLFLRPRELPSSSDVGVGKHAWQGEAERFCRPHLRVRAVHPTTQRGKSCANGALDGIITANLRVPSHLAVPKSAPTGPSCSVLRYRPCASAELARVTVGLASALTSRLSPPGVLGEPRGPTRAERRNTIRRILEAATPYGRGRWNSRGQCLARAHQTTS